MTALIKNVSDISEQFSASDVLVGILHSARQLEANVNFGFYHIPVKMLPCEQSLIKHVALYRSKAVFGENSAGIYNIGEVLDCAVLPRYEIKEIPATSSGEELYVRFNIERWDKLNIKSRGASPSVCMTTNMLLIENAKYTAELYISSPEHYLIYKALTRAKSRTGRVGQSEDIPAKDGCRICVCGNAVGIYGGDDYYTELDMRNFFSKPHTFLKQIEPFADVSKMQ